MIQPRALAVATLALLPLAAPAATPTAVAQDEFEQLLRQELAAVESASPDELWSRAAAVRGLAREFDGARVDSTVASLLAQETGGRAVLLLSGLSLQGEDPDLEDLSGRLVALLDSDDRAVARGAAGMLASPGFARLPSDAREDAREALRTVVEDGERDPALRLEAAGALHVHGDGNEKRLAARQMRAFLGSADPELRALGALALARSGAEITGDLMDELERLAALPGPQGVLADSYLRRERDRELYDRKLKNQRRYYEANPADVRVDQRSDSPESQFRTILEMVKSYHLDGDKVEEDRLLDAAMDGMLRYLDEHSAYFAPVEFERFEQDLEGEYGGIGAYVSVDRADSLFTITRPIYSGPAYEAGLRTDDKIVRIEEWSTIGQPLEDIIKRLKGKPGTKVKLYVWRQGMDLRKIDRPTEDMAVTVARARITIPPLNYETLPGDVAVVDLREFSRTATRELRKTLEELLASGTKGVILDLRNNPGGLLEEATSVAGLFLPKNSLVVTTRSKIGPDDKHFTEDEPVVPMDMPVVVMINRFSASASEIVSGALQDHERAVVVGERSFGKGSVQNLRPIPGVRDDQWRDENGNRRYDSWETLTYDADKDGQFDFAPRIKLTVAKYLLPSGRSIHREFDRDLNMINPGGVQPDVEVGARDIDTWRLEEINRINRQRKAREYVDANWDEHRELFVELAVNDDRDPARYPGFEEFYQGLSTPLPVDDVRFVLRQEIRRRVQDERGRQFGNADYVEDPQVQEAVTALLAKLGTTPDSVPEYATTFKPRASVGVNVAYGERREVEETLEAVSKAREGDGKLDPETLDRLKHLLEGSLE